jgi:hypothetical protein
MVVVWVSSGHRRFVRLVVISIMVVLWVNCIFSRPRTVLVVERITVLFMRVILGKSLNRVLLQSVLIQPK